MKFKLKKYYFSLLSPIFYIVKNGRTYLTISDVIVYALRLPVSEIWQLRLKNERKKNDLWEIFCRIYFKQRKNI